MEQTKALNALEPFLVLSKSAASPRAAADLTTRATSAPNTFLFAELLSSPNIKALAASPEFAPHHSLLHIFSYGTYETYRSTDGLPTLNDAQTLKLRQLSLLSLATDRRNLTYDALKTRLGLTSSRELEDLVITAVYANLLQATLDPARQAVQVSSISPLRDVAPGSVPDMIVALKAWGSRCTSTLGEVEERMRAIGEAAAKREKKKRAEQQEVELKLSAAMLGSGAGTEGDSRQDLSTMKKKGVVVGGSRRDRERDVDTEGVGDTMEVDEVEEERKTRSSKRKM